MHLLVRATAIGVPGRGSKVTFNPPVQEFRFNQKQPALLKRLAPACITSSAKTHSAAGRRTSELPRLLPECNALVLVVTLLVCIASIHLSPRPVPDKPFSKARVCTPFALWLAVFINHSPKLEPNVIESTPTKHLLADPDSHG